MNREDKYFDEDAFKWVKESELGYDIWNNKYRYNNESFEDCDKRLIQELVDKTDLPIFE